PSFRGRLHSSLRRRGRPQSASNMTTWINSQFPRPDFHRRVQRHYGLQDTELSRDDWKGTQAAWKLLFTKVVILLCFLHGWLKIRDRAKHLKEVFAEVSRRVWDTYHAPDRRSFAQRLRSLRQWAAGHLTGIVLEKVLDLCGKRDRWSIASRHPGGPRTSNMLDRLMRGMTRYF